MRKKWLLPLLGLTLALTAVSAVAAFALNSEGSDNDDQDVANEWKLVEASGWPGSRGPGGPSTGRKAPAPGVAYINIALPGFRMVLEADGQAYSYETDASERVVFVG